MTKKHFVYAAVVLCATACGGGSDAAAPKASEAPPPAFVFSTRPGVSAPDDPDNWCSLPFEEGVVVNVETTNVNRRYFGVGSGAYRVVVRKGNTAAPFYLVQKGQQLEVLTADQYPYCLMRSALFRLENDGQRLVFDDPPGYYFALDAVPWQGGFKVTIEFPPTSEQGLLVHREHSVR